MTHIGTQTIKTKRLTLRRFTVEDTVSAFINWESDSDVTEFLCWKPVSTIKETKEILSGWISCYKDDNFYQWAIVPDDINEPIGTISVVGHDDKTSMVHIGYCIGKKWWHQGYMSEALAAVINFFFTQVGTNRIEAQHDPNNPHSGGVMKKCGMVYEGTKRQGDYSNRGIVDACMYSILRDEWRDKSE